MATFASTIGVSLMVVTYCSIFVTIVQIFLFALAVTYIAHVSYMTFYMINAVHIIHQEFLLTYNSAYQCKPI